MKKQIFLTGLLLLSQLCAAGEIQMKVDQHVNFSIDIFTQNPWGGSQTERGKAYPGGEAVNFKVEKGGSICVSVKQGTLGLYEDYLFEVISDQPLTGPVIWNGQTWNDRFELPPGGDAVLNLTGIVLDRTAPCSY